MYPVRNVLHSHNTLTQHIQENLPSVTRPFLSSRMDLGTRLGTAYIHCTARIMGMRLHAYTDGHLCRTARILGMRLHAHKMATSAAQQGSWEWGYTHGHLCHTTRSLGMMHSKDPGNEATFAALASFPGSPPNTMTTNSKKGESLVPFRT